MSFIRVPTKSDVKLPSVVSISEQSLAPIEITLAKCKRQAVATVIICLGVFSLGNVFGCFLARAAIAVDLLRNENEIEFNEGAMKSLFIFGALISGPAAGYSMLKFGRKKAVFGHAVLLIIGWTFILMAKLNINNGGRAAVLYIGRILTGFAGAGCFTIAPVYVREVCDDEVRSIMGSIVPLFLVLGNFSILVLGLFLNWFQLSVACWTIPPVLAVAIFYIPDTPQYLLLHEKKKEAKKSFFWLTSGFPEEEQQRLFKRVVVAVDLLSSKQAMKSSERRKQEARKKLKITSRPVLHPLILSLLLILFQQGSGTNLITTYSTDILRSGSHSIDAKVGAVLIALCLATFTGVATVLVDRMQRKTLLVASSIIMGLMFLFMGIYFYFAKGSSDKDINDSAMNNFGWLPIACSVVYIAFYACGLGSVSWIVILEINHPDFQEFSGSLASTMYWLIAFVSTLTFPYLRDSINYHWTFFFYSTMCFTATTFVIVFIFETNGKSTKEIMQHYQGTLYNPEDDLGEDGDGDTKSIGSVLVVGQRVENKHRFSAASNTSSMNSTWSDEMQTIYSDQGEERRTSILSS